MVHKRVFYILILNCKFFSISTNICGIECLVECMSSYFPRVKCTAKLVEEFRLFSLFFFVLSSVLFYKTNLRTCMYAENLIFFK